MNSWLLLAALVTHQPTDPTYNENILIFTGEVRNFVDLATDMQSLNNEAAGDTRDQKMQETLKELQSTASRVADLYFTEAQAENRSEFTSFLSTTLAAHADLKNYFIFIGNAFASEAQKILDHRASTHKKIFVWSTIGGVVLGLGGGALLIKYKKSLATAGISAIGIAVAATATGYMARHFLPVSLDVTNAEDFLSRFPSGEDFAKELDASSMDLAMILDGSDEAGE